MHKLVILKKSDLSISQSTDVFYGGKEAQGVVINPYSGGKQSFSYELPFIIKSTNKSIPTIQEEFCIVSRVVVNLTEQHANEKEATLSGNKSKQNPQKPLKENRFFTELKGKNG